MSPLHSYPTSSIFPSNTTCSAAGSVGQVSGAAFSNTQSMVVVDHHRRDHVFLPTDSALSMVCTMGTFYPAQKGGSVSGGYSAFTPAPISLYQLAD
jgi:hypothetical protein